MFISAFQGKYETSIRWCGEQILTFWRLETSVDAFFLRDQFSLFFFEFLVSFVSMKNSKVLLSIAVFGFTVWCMKGNGQIINSLSYLHA